MKSKKKINKNLIFLLSLIFFSMFMGCVSTQLDNMNKMIDVWGKAIDLLSKTYNVPEDKFIIYYVVKGDNLWNIAGKPNIYNNCFMWTIIFKYNSDYIMDPNVIEVNQKLLIKTNISDQEKDEIIKVAQNYKGEN